jgi:hypothetical protein
VTTWINNYSIALNLMGGKGVALGTDATSPLPLFSDPAFLSVFPPVPPALLSYPAAPGPATSPASMSVHSSFQNCYASSRSISLAVLIAP